MTTIRIVLADDQVLFREALAALLSTQPDMRVVAQASNGAQAVQLAREYQPDVMLMDVQMPETDGVTATRLLHQEQAGARILMLTTFEDDEHVFEGLRAGAIGYLLKDTPAQKLIEAVRAAARGESHLHPTIAAKLISEVARQPTKSTEKAEILADPLTERELDILRCMVQGLNNREIAAKLVITEGTVKNHVTNIFGKLAVRDRVQAILKAQQLRLI